MELWQKALEEKGVSSRERNRTALKLLSSIQIDSFDVEKNIGYDLTNTFNKMVPEYPNGELDWNIWYRKVSQVTRQLSARVFFFFQD